MKHSTRHYLSQTSLVAKIITLLLVLCSVFAFAGQIVSIVITKADSAAQSTLTPGTANLTADGTSTQLLTVTVKDANGNNMTSGAADIAITKSSGTGTISSVTDNGNGTYTAIITSPTAIGSGIFVATLAGEAVKGGTDSQTEVTVTYSAGTATKLIIQTQPGGSSSGGLLGTQPVVRIADANGNTVTTSTASVSVTPSTGSTLGGTQTVAAVNGIATFTNLTLAGTAGTNFTLSFTSGSLTSAPSGNVTVSAGSASKVSITRASAGTASGAAFTTQPQVTIQDAAGNTMTSASDVVTATITSGGTLVGTVTATASSGVATFTDLGISGSTGTEYTITYTVTNLTAATYSITVSGGTATQITLNAVNNQSATAGSAVSTAPSVIVKDDSNNPVLGVSVTFANGTGGSVSGTMTSTTGADGIATFAGVWTLGTTAGLNTLIASSTALSGSTVTFTATGIAGTLDHFAISSISSPQTSGTAITGITLTAQDVNNNTVTTFTGTVTYSGTAGIAGTSSAFTAGVLSSVSVTPTNSGSGMTFIVTWSSKTGTATFDVNAGSAQATPTFSPVAGTIAFGTTVTIASSGADAIYYTTDGTTPTTSSTNQATTPLEINGAYTVKALAVKAWYDNSAVSSAAYTQAFSANLTGLALSGSPSGYIFAAGTYSYSSITVPNNQSGITVTPTGTGTITVNGTAVTSGSASVAISLTAGSATTITVVATETGKSAKSYTLSVTRDIAPLQAGAQYGGGIVAYILVSGDLGYDANVQHGLIVAISDQSVRIIWAGAAYQSSVIGTNTATGSGSSNTDLIIAQNDLGSVARNSYAAGLCKAYSVGIYTDWYLPSKNELHNLYLNRVAINTGITTAGGDVFAGIGYWSSSESMTTRSWLEGLNNGYQASNLKSGSQKVRAVRSF